MLCLEKEGIIRFRAFVTADQNAHSEFTQVIRRECLPLEREHKQILNFSQQVLLTVTWVNNPGTVFCVFQTCVIKPIHWEGQLSKALEEGQQPGCTVGVEQEQSVLSASRSWLLDTILQHKQREPLQMLIPELECGENSLVNQRPRKCLKTKMGHGKVQGLSLYHSHWPNLVKLDHQK